MNTSMYALRVSWEKELGLRSYLIAHFALLEVDVVDKKRRKNAIVATIARALICFRWALCRLYAIVALSSGCLNPWRRPCEWGGEKVLNPFRRGRMRGTKHLILLRWHGRTLLVAAYHVSTSQRKELLPVSPGKRERVTMRLRI